MRMPLIAAIGLAGCGGSPALLQPAHPLPRDVVEYGAGVSTQVTLGSASDAIARVESATDASGDPSSTRVWLRGAYQKNVIAPGVAPWVGARAGLGSGNEGSLVYTGRNLRLGARHAWLWGEYALSLGAGLTSVFAQRAREPLQSEQDGLPAGRIDWPARGFGLDAPLVFGWTSDAELIQAWAGARAGFETIWGDLPFTSGGAHAPAEAQAHHWQAGGLLGLSVGLSPVWVRAELHATWHHVAGEAELPTNSGTETTQDDFSGFSLSPAAAFVLQF